MWFSQKLSAFRCAAGRFNDALRILALGVLLAIGFADTVFAIDVCDRQTRPEGEWTFYCPGDSKCIGKTKCTPSAAAMREFLRKQEEARRQGERNLERARKEMDAFRQALKQASDDMARRAVLSREKARFFGQQARKFGRQEQAKVQQVQRGYGRCPQSYPFDCSCEPAGGGAAWHAVCRPNAPSTATPRFAYRNTIDPQTLYHRAAQGCQGVSWDARDSCVVMGKVDILMAIDALVRSTCGNVARDKLVACVDGVYVTGRESERDRLVRLVRALPDTLPVTIQDQMPPDD